ncbi:MAG: CPBP family intramembrane metalloprotease [Actinobacteria bacterium]|nr:CPBP family intramembrane metalloprotease [Actinomycetota bacterium]
MHNVAANRLLPARWYVPANLGTAAALLGLALVSGVGLDELGLSPSALVPGLAAGIAGGLLVVGVIVLAAATPARRLLADGRMVGVGARGTAYRCLVRIPCGTVVLEEVAFRGVLLALVERSTSTGVAVGVSSLLFGLWHILPTLPTLDANGLARSGRARVVAVAGAVLFTALVGVVFCWLRYRTGSLVASALVHVAANSGATVAAFLVLCSQRAELCDSDPTADELNYFFASDDPGSPLDDLLR